MEPRASLVIPNLNCPLVGNTLAAVGRQRLEPGTLEVLVVGRDDPGLVPRNAGVRFVETSERLPPGAARNRGAAAARGERLLFTDADCRPREDWAPRLLEALERAPIVGGSVCFDLGGNVWAVADNIASFQEFLADRPAEEGTERPLGSLNLGVTRAAWERVGPFDETLTTSEDIDWVLRARAAGLATAFEPAAVVEHAAVRRTRRELVEHADWYGRHFHAFRKIHPGVFDSGPTWSSRRRLAMAAPLKAAVAALAIFRRHRVLWPALRALPAVALFKYSWYRAIVANWPDEREAA